MTLLKDETDADPAATYRAVGGHAQAVGRSPGEAVDALTARLPADQSGTLIIVRDLRPDPYFTQEQRRRLGELMGRWRALLEGGGNLGAVEQSELQGLVDAEVEATTLRAQEAWRELSS